MLYPIKILPQLTLFYLSIIVLSLISFKLYGQTNLSLRISSANKNLHVTNEWQKLLNKSEFERVISTSTAILQIDTNNQDALYYQAVALHLSNRQEVAIPLFHQIVNQHENNSNHVSDLRYGMSQFYLGNNQAAIVALKRLTKTTPNLQAYKILGYALAKQNQYQAAISAFNQVIAKHQDHSIYYNRGLVYFALKDWQNAAKDMKSSIEQRPKFQLPYFDLITIYVLMNQPKQALMWLNTLLSQRITDLTRLQQDPALSEFVQSDNYIRLLQRYKLDNEPK